MALLAFVASLGTSIMSPANADLAIYLGVEIEATALTLSLFVLGQAFGPIVFGQYTILRNFHNSSHPLTLLVHASANKRSLRPQDLNATGCFRPRGLHNRHSCE
jgi:hypothetical protein